MSCVATTVGVVSVAVPATLGTDSGVATPRVIIRGTTSAFAVTPSAMVSSNVA